MRTSRKLLHVVAVLLAWKAVRTDWEVVAPYWYRDTDPPALDVFTTTSYIPPVSPIWRPPIPAELKPHARSWSDFFGGGGAYGITGAPVLRPHWLIIGLKLFGGFMVALFILFPLTSLARDFYRLARTPNRDSNSK